MSTWLGRLTGRRADDPAAFEVLLARQSAYVAQKTVLDYCRVKAGRDEARLFSDPDFLAALDHCRWQTFGAAAGDLCALAEAWLRPHAPGRESDLGAALAAMGARILQRQGAPGAERANLGEAAAALPLHLSRLQDAPPRQADRLSLLAEPVLFATLPIHPDQRVGESPAIKGALRFHIIAAQDEMARLFEPAGLTRKLLGA